MRIRGRRVVLLIAGALPLLAEDRHSRSTATVDDSDVVVPKATGTPSADAEQQQQSYLQNQQHQHQQQEQEDVLLTGPSAAEALHEESPSTLLPLNLLQIESEFLNHTHVHNSLTAGVIRDENNFIGADDDPPLKDMGEDEGQVHGKSKEPPDMAAKEASEASTNNAEEKDERNGLVEELQNHTEYDGESSNNISENSANPVADASGDDNVKEETSFESMEALDGRESDRVEAKPKVEQETDVSENEMEPEETESSQEDSSNETAPEESLDRRKNDGLEDGSDTLAADNGKDGDTKTTTITTGSLEEEHSPSSGGDKHIQEEEPASGPQVDKVDDDDEEISKRVAVDYASKSAGALVLEKSPNFKGTSNLLNGNRDKYAISPCEENKFVVLSLSEDILVKEVKLANYELYSSRVKDFQIQISATMGNWVDLGSYKATPASGVQSFELREPAWGRYLKFKFNSHYGDEYYCTLSQIMVHGSTMVQGFHEHLQETSEEEAAHEEGGNEQTLGSFARDDDVDGSAARSDAPSDEAQTTEKATAREETTTTTSADADKDEETQFAEAGGSEGVLDDSSVEPTDETASASDDDTIDVEGLSDGANAEKVNETRMETEEGGGDKMHSKKNRNASTAIPAASITLSSNVFTTMMGRLEPLHLKSMHRLSSMRTPDSNQFQSILAKASDSTTKAIKRALTDPAILDNLQLWNEANIEEPFPPEAFGKVAIGPREQTLIEKLSAYIEENDDNLTMTVADEGEGDIEVPGDATNQEGKDDRKDDSNKTEKQSNVAGTPGNVKEESSEDEPQGTKTANSEDAYDSLHDTDLALANLLDKLPSIECLKKLDFAAFKEKALASRKGGPGAGGNAAAGNPAEPIFKMLTDQIKVLQSNLLVHDQFTKEAVQCYQRVLLDVVVELQTMRVDHEIRLTQLEQDLEETKTVRWIFVLYQIVMGLPYWASLLTATFFTSFVSPNLVTKPLDLVQGLLEKYISEGDHVVLSWTITGCIMVLCCVATISLCYRLLQAIRKIKPGAEESSKKDPAEENSCRFTVKNAEGKIVSVSTKPLESEEVEEGEASLGKDEANSEEDSEEQFLVPAEVESVAIDAFTLASMPSDVVDLVSEHARDSADGSVSGSNPSEAATATAESIGMNTTTILIESATSELHTTSKGEQMLAGSPSSLPNRQDPEFPSLAKMEEEGVPEVPEVVEEELVAVPSVEDPDFASPPIMEEEDVELVPEVVEEEPVTVSMLKDPELATPVSPEREEMEEVLAAVAEEAVTVPSGSCSPTHETGCGTQAPAFLESDEEAKLVLEVGPAPEPTDEAPIICSSHTGEPFDEDMPASFEDEKREESGARTPEVDTATLLAGNFSIGPVSPSSVAKVSEFTNGSGGTDFGGSVNLLQCKNNAPLTGEAPMEGQSSRSESGEAPGDKEASEQKRRASF